MDIVASPLDDVLEFAALINQITQLVLDYLGITVNLPLVIALVAGFGLLMLLRGYLVLNSSVLAINLGLGVSYLVFLVATDDAAGKITQMLIFIGATLVLFFLVDTIKFYLIGTFIAVYSVTGIIGPLFGLTDPRILLPPGIAAGLFISSRVNSPLEDLFDDLTSFVTSGMGVFLLFVAGILVFGIQTIDLGFTQTCGLLLLLLAPVFWYTSAQRTHRQQHAETASPPGDPTAETRPQRFAFKTALVMVCTVILTILNGVPTAERVNQVQLNQPIDRFITDFNDYKDKLTADSNSHYFVTLDKPLELYDCPSYDCAVTAKAQPDHRLILLDYSPETASASMWLETPYHFRVYFVPVSALATEVVEAPVSQ